MTHLPQCVKLLSIRDREFLCLVPVDTVMHHLSFMEQTQSVRPAEVPLTDPEDTQGWETNRHGHHHYLEDKGIFDMVPLFYQLQW